VERMHVGEEMEAVLLPSAATNFPIGCLISGLVGMRFRGWTGRQDDSLLCLQRGSTDPSQYHAILPQLPNARRAGAPLRSSAAAILPCDLAVGESPMHRLIATPARPCLLVR
jgi:hypothetical protein